MITHIRPSSRALILFACLVFCGLAVIQVKGQTREWNAASGSWYDGSKWLPVGVPTNTDDVVITNGGSSFINGGTVQILDLTIGDLGTGNTLVIDGGAQVVSNRITMGNGNASNGSLRVTGSGTMLDAGGVHQFGLFGGAEMIIEDGATFTSYYNGIIAAELGKHAGYLAPLNLFRVDGAGSSATFETLGTGYLFIGEGNAKLEVLNGAELHMKKSGIRTSNTSLGTAEIRVEGPGSKLVADSAIELWGNGATRSLHVLDAGYLKASSYDVDGRWNQLINTYVDGAGSHLDIAGTINLKYGQLFMINGAHVTADTLNVGEYESFYSYSFEHGFASLLWGSILDTNTGRIGTQGGDGTVEVKGAGSLWTNTDSLFVANGTASESSTANLEVRLGGSVTTQNLHVATGSAADEGNILVRDVGSSLEVSGELRLGEVGTGNITIQNGGQVETARAQLGLNNGSVGNLVVDGVGSSFTHSSNLAMVVGVSGNGTVTVTNGGSLATLGLNGLRIAESVGSTGSVTVGDSGSNISVVGLTEIGSAGNGTLEVSNGATMTTTALQSSNLAGSSSSILVSGSGSTLAANGTFTVGAVTSSTMSVLAGGKVSSTNTMTFASAANSSATMTISGPGSEVTAPNIMEIGRSGTANVTISNGGKLKAANPYLGAQPGGSGTLTVTGLGSEVEATTRLYIGRFGSGTASFNNQAKLNGAVTVGSSTNGVGSLTLDGASTWDFNNKGVTLGSGSNAVGTITLIGDSTAVGESMSIGALSSSSGTLNVAQSGTSLTLTNLLRVGNSGTGLVNLSQGAFIDADRIEIGQGPNSNGQVVVNGQSTALLSSNTSAINGNMLVGDFGTGSLIIENQGYAGVLSGARVGNQSAFAGSGKGMVTVTGADSIWDVSLGVILANANSTEGTVNLNNGGLLRTSGIVKGNAGGTAKLSFDGGELRLTGNQANLFGGFAAGNAELKAGGGTINTQSFEVSSSASIAGVGDLNKTGTGRLRLTGQNTYEGVTNITAGTLFIDDAGSINESSGININGAELQYSSSVNYGGGAVNFVSGTLSGTNWQGNLANLTIGTNQRISPGNSVGQAIAETQTWTGGGTYVWEINDATGLAGGTSGWDLISFMGTLTLSATSLTPFVIEVTSLKLDNTPGLASNFDPTANYQWLIAQTNQPIAALDSLFIVNLTNFSNASNGLWSVIRGDVIGQGTNEMYLSYSAIPEPATATLLLAGLAATLLLRRRSRPTS